MVFSGYCAGCEEMVTFAYDNYPGDAIGHTCENCLEPVLLTMVMEVQNEGQAA